MTDETDMLSMPVRGFVAGTAARTPTPGGGSVAGVVGALAAALGEMALSFTRGKKAFAAHEALYARLAGRLERAREMFQQLVADDVAAYRHYQQTARLADSPDKAEALQVAVAATIDVPREATKLALAVLADLAELADKCNPHLVSDLLGGAVLAEAVCLLSDCNVRINLPQVADAAAREDVGKGSAADLATAANLRNAIQNAIKKHLP